MSVYFEAIPARKVSSDSLNNNKKKYAPRSVSFIFMSLELNHLVGQKAVSDGGEERFSK